MKTLIRLNILAVFFCCLYTMQVNAGGAPDLDVKWDLKPVPEDAQGNLSTVISLIVNGKKYEIATEMGTYSEITSDNYKDYKIPKNALIACTGWWAGAGAEYWIIKKGNDLNVLIREESEGNPDHPGDYVTKPKKIKTISLD